MNRWTVVGAVAALAIPAAVVAHPGGLNSEGCHNDRKNGGYHCHRGSGGSPSTSRPQALRSQPPAGRAYANCSEARAAGAAPVRRGDPGYGRHLDRDGDGIGCER
ncbi:excalibur calcium-binding domain-containing protein [Brevundimonas albigilva]|uniref:excalibur calcium-binding domain-containing protein n=1 Tax=Brevundimonas albigilva TaxID=1312364 RepID=UPI00322216EA